MRKRQSRVVRASASIWVLGLALLSSTVASAREAEPAARTHDEAGDQAGSRSGAESGVEEIVVIASKSGADVRDLPGAVSAITGDRLADLGAQSAGDYLAKTPGVVFNQQQPGLSTITIRGVNTTTGSGTLSQGTTGSYINDIPLTDPFFSAGTPDIDTFDVDNIQVYRGPQGVLFGSSSLGGAVNYLANHADVGAVDAAAEMTQGITRDAKGLNSAYKLMLNVPVVTDRFAVRAVGVYRADQGFIENIGTGVRNANDSRVRGGRLLFTWAPSDSTTVTGLALYQKTTTDDAPFQNADLRPLTKQTALAEPSRASVLLYNLRLDQDVGFGTFTALATYHRKRAFQAIDLTRFGRFGFDTPYVTDEVGTRGHAFELRLASPTDRKFQWLVGAFYDHTTEDIVELTYAKNASAVANALLGPGSGSTDGDVWGSTINTFGGTEEALFGEASYNFFGRLKLSAGGRLFKTRTKSRTEGFGLLYAAFVNGQINYLPLAVKQRETGFNPRASLSLDIAKNASLYVLASKGFRFGGGNVNPDPALPETYGSDSLWNYEAGLKSEWFDRRLRVDVSAFKIDWSNIQLGVNTASGTTGLLNAGDAKIKGVEAELTVRPLAGLELTSATTYLDAKLTSVQAGAGLAFGVVAGSRLPGSSRWLMSNSVRYQLGTSQRPFILLSHRYASKAPALLQQFAAPGRNATVGGYNIFDLRAGLEMGNLSISFFLNNVTDKRGVASASYLNPPLANEIRQYIVRPRTVGVTLSAALR